MDAIILLNILKELPDAIDIIIIGRGHLATISLSITEDSWVPPNWSFCMEPPKRKIPGWKRIILRMPAYAGLEEKPAAE